VLLTAVLAYVLSPFEFGRFTIAWALAALFESAILKPLLDDPLPSVAAVLSSGRVRQLRACYYLWSTTLAGAIAGVAIMLSPFCVVAGHDERWLVAATGLMILGCRLQNALRRVCYLDRRLRLIVCAAALYFATLAAGVAIMIALGPSAPGAMLCSFFASIAALSFVLVRRKDLKRPTAKMFFWSLRRLAAAGRWIVAAGLAFWAGSVGVIPVAGILLGGAAGGGLRILFLLFAPLSQLTAALLSFMIPRAAVRLRERGDGAIRQVAIAKTLLFGALSATYGLCVVVSGIYLVRAHVFPGAYGITVVQICWMAAAMTLEGIWAGLALPLYATAQTSSFLVSRLVALPLLVTLFPIAAWMWGMTGTVAAIAATSATSVLVLARELRTNRPNAKPLREGSIVGAIRSEVL
jgi:MFS family permease